MHLLCSRGLGECTLCWGLCYTLVSSVVPKNLALGGVCSPQPKRDLGHFFASHEPVKPVKPRGRNGTSVLMVKLKDC